MKHDDLTRRNGGPLPGDDQGKNLPVNDKHMTGTGAGRPDMKRGHVRVTHKDESAWGYHDQKRGGFAGLGNGLDR